MAMVKFESGFLMANPKGPTGFRLDWTNLLLSSKIIRRAYRLGINTWRIDLANTRSAIKRARQNPSAAFATDTLPVAHALL